MVGITESNDCDLEFTSLSGLDISSDDDGDVYL
jgi:hypothetical protein